MKNNIVNKHKEISNKVVFKKEVWLDIINYISNIETKLSKIEECVKSNKTLNDIKEIIENDKI